MAPRATTNIVCIRMKLKDNDAPADFVLAVLSIVGGCIGIPAILGGGNQFEHFLEPVFEQANVKLALPVSDLSRWSIC